MISILYPGKCPCVSVTDVTHSNVVSFQRLLDRQHDPRNVLDVTHSDVVSFQHFLDQPRDPRNVLDCDPRTVTSTVDRPELSPDPD